MDDDAAAAVAVVSDEDLLSSSVPDEVNTSDEQQDNHEDHLSGQTTDQAAVQIVHSECESDDEWNYVKPKNTAAEEEEQTLSQAGAEVEEEQVEKAHQEVEDHEEKTAEIHEQHAEAQAIAESQEHCAEVSGEGLLRGKGIWGILDNWNGICDRSSRRNDQVGD